MSVENENGKYMRYYGRIQKTNEQVVIVTLRCESKPDHTKCIFFKRLPVNLQPEFTGIINSPACQGLKNRPLYEFLQGKTFSSIMNKNVYSTLLDLAVVRDIPSKEVLVECPYDQYKTIAEIEEDIRMDAARRTVMNDSKEGEQRAAQEALDAATRAKLEEQQKRMEALEATQKASAEQVTKLSVKVDAQNDTLNKMMEMMSNMQTMISKTTGTVPVVEKSELKPIPVSSTEDWMNDLPPIQG